MKHLLFVLGAFCLSCHNVPNATMPSSARIPAEMIFPTSDQQARRQQSEAFCKAHNIPIYSNPTALFVGPEERVVLRDKNEIVNRALAFCYVGLKSEGLAKNTLAELAKSWQIMDKLTPDEKLYVLADRPTEQQKIDANWKYENLHVLLWSLSYIDSLGYPDQLCRVASDVKIIHDLTEAQFRQNARLRSKKEILDQSDLMLRLDWACVDARTKNQKPAGSLSQDVVVERHRTFNWLIRYLNQDWDDVSTDT